MQSVCVLILNLFFKFKQSTIWRCHRHRRCRRWSTRNGAWLDTPHFYSNAFIQCWYFDVYILYRRTLCGVDIPSHSKGTHPSVELYCTVLCRAVPCVYGTTYIRYSALGSTLSHFVCEYAVRLVKLSWVQFVCRQYECKTLATAQQYYTYNTPAEQNRTHSVWL